MEIRVNLAKQIHKELNQEADLRLIKKIISLYEKLKNQNDDEVMSFDDVKLHMHNLLGNISVADSVKAFRERESITQKELALKSGIKQQHISEIERGLRSIGVATAKKLASALNCDYRSLL